MTILEAIEQRHSVRKYQDKPIEAAKIQELNQEINACNQEGNLSIQLITDDPDVFKGLMAHYGGFRNVTNYIALVGPADSSLDEKTGYYGERIALKAQQLGLNTCWVAATYKKDRCRAVVSSGQKLVCILALGYGATQGTPHKSKPMEKLCRVNGGGEPPKWFQDGMRAALLAPTAMNKQNFMITLDGDHVTYEALKGTYTKVDLGIVKYHFQTAANRC
ncbi:MAG: nitroreductase [Hungatella hathewayi]|nr:nitroreductase [Hungatella hathewayi]